MNSSGFHKDLLDLDYDDDLDCEADFMCNKCFPVANAGSESD